jgi:C1A family cysteine protease
MILFFSVLVCSAAQAVPLTFDQLKNEMSKSDSSGWDIDESLVNSENSYRIKNLKGGALPEDPNSYATIEAFPSNEPSGPSISAALPLSWDWRNIGGKNFMSNADVAQGDCGSCVAFAISATLEATLNIACDQPGSPFKVSRQHLFSCGGGSCSSGWKMSNAISFLEASGIPDEPCFPYASSDGSDLSCNLTCSDVSSRLITKITTSRPSKGYIDISAIKHAVMKGPVLANLILYEDLQYYKSGVYKHLKGNKLGGHAVSIVGWNDDTSSWIVQNSWGSKWGEAGYFNAAYDDPKVLLGRYSWSFNVVDAKSSGVCSD